MKLRRWTIIRRNDDGTWGETGRKFWRYRNACKARSWHNSFATGTLAGAVEMMFYGPRFLVWDRGVPLPRADAETGDARNLRA